MCHAMTFGPYDILRSSCDRILSRTWKPRKPGDLNLIYPGPDIAWNLPHKVRKPGQSKKFCRKYG